MITTIFSSLPSARFHRLLNKTVSIVTMVAMVLGPVAPVIVFPATAIAATAGDVMINEFASDASPEWVELYNTTGSAIDVSGWKIQDRTGASLDGTATTTIASGTIAAGGFFAVDVSGLNNDGDIITLFDDGGLQIEEVSYGNASSPNITAPAPGESAGRTTDGGTPWVIFSTPTKGATNVSIPVPVTEACNGSSFDSGFTNGSVNGQGGWTSTGTFDQEVVDNTYGFASFGCKSLRISNAVTSGSFGDQTFSAPTATAAGESTVAANNHYEAEFSIASTMLSQQMGLALSVSPDDGNGSRMSYISFTDAVDGIHTTFYDVVNSGPYPKTASFNATSLPVLSRSTSHTIKFVIDFVDGPANDVAKIYIDGVLVHTGTTWEDYYRYDPEQSGNDNVLAPIDALIFRVAGTAAPTTEGNGFLIDGTALSTSFTAPDTSSVKFVGSPKYVRENNSGDISAQLVAPTSVSAVNFYVDSTSTAPISGINVGGATATTDWWRLKTALTSGMHTIYAQVQIGSSWYDVNDTGIVYALGAPTGSFVIPSDTHNVFRSMDNPLRVKVGDLNDQFSRVKFTVNGTDYTVNRADCDLRQAGNYVLCDLDKAANWAGLPEGTYTGTAILYTKANSHTTITSDSFTVDSTKPDISNLVLTPAQSTYDDSVTASADATDGTGSGIDNVKFYVTTPRIPDGACTGNGAQLATSTDSVGSSGTYSSLVDLSGVADGNYCMSAIAKDAAAGHSRIISQKFTVSHVVVPTAPTAPILSSPDNGSATSTNNFYFRWYDSVGADPITYEFQSSLNSAESGGVLTTGVWHSGVLPGTSIHSTGAPDGTWYWQVRAKDTDGDFSPWSSIWSMSIDQKAPATTTITAPTNNWVFNSTPITGSWTAVTNDTSGNADVSGIAKYQVAYAYDDGHTFSGSTCPSVTTIDDKTVGGCRDTTATSRNHSPSISEQGGVTIYVRAIDNAGNVGEWSDGVHYYYDTEATPGPVDPGDSYAHIILATYTTNGDDDSFEFGVASSDGTYAATTTLTTIGGAATTTLDVDPGTYGIAQGAEDDWISKNVSCDYGDGSGSYVGTGAQLILAAGETATCTFTNQPASSQSVTVYQGSLATDLADALADLSKWFFYNDETDVIDNSLGAFVSGPAPTPLGDGSAQISVSGTQRRNLATYQFSGTLLENITAIKFSTYNPSAGNGGSMNRAAYLNFNVDFDGSDTWQKRLAFVPSQNGSVTQNAWQEWDAVDGGNAEYSYSGTLWPDTTLPGSTLRTWDDIVSSYPGVRVRVTDSWLGLRVGEPYADGYTENLDKFEITIDDGTHATTTIADFEPDSGTTISISGVSPEPSEVGSPYTVSWDLSASSGATPLGQVSVAVNGSSASGCTADAATGSCDITPTEAGSVTLAAQFTGDPGFDDSNSEGTTVTHTVNEPTVPVAIVTTGGGGGGGVGGGIISNSLLGDINRDGRVDILDFALLMAATGMSGTSLDADLNRDGTVGLADMAILFANWTN